MVYVHDIEPYPRKLWVAVDEDMEALSEAYELEEHTDDLNDPEELRQYDALTFHCKKDDECGFMVFVENPDMDTLAHEAAHVTLEVYNQCEMIVSNSMDQEPFCYLLENVFRMIRRDVDGRGKEDEDGGGDRQGNP